MATTTFDVGSTRVHVLEDGVFITDAGNLFGGRRNARIRGAMHAVLAEAGDELVLVDAGFGPELPEGLEGRYELRRDGDDLITSLEATGHTPEDVTRVVLSHLDPDHVGWALDPPSFPNATVYLQEAALEEARGLPEDSARRMVVPAAERGVQYGWCKLLDGDCDVMPGVHVQVRDGHSVGHQVVWIHSEGQTTLYTADLAPSKIFLDPDTIAGVDSDPETARQNRIEVLEEAASREATVILYHEPREFLVKVRATDDGFEAEPVDAS